MEENFYLNVSANVTSKIIDNYEMNREIDIKVDQSRAK